ncbi:AraC family transcriptional regulator [Sutterella sp.]|uniref:AraC family transcriptional regulator n=1 Tax=Sutterella sp. TaxID=1981025 RepID=UPI0026E089ED|nr:AraC family transcriptional regulator [Sutterella sp.]MDO5531362.1 AraC family transcriptional regulator [Sutterella sp.]
MAEDNRRLAQMLEMFRALDVPHGTGDTAIPGFHTYRYEQEMPLSCSTGDLACSLILSGEKSVSMGAREIVYHTGESLLCGASVPNVYRALGVSKENPFLSFALILDRSLLMELAEGLPMPAGEAAAPEAVTVFHANDDLLEDFERLLKLLANPEQIPVRAPLVIRDIHYLLLTGPTGASLMPLLRDAAPAGAIIRAVSWLKKNFRSSFTIEELARMHNMSTSNFHRQFKLVTGMTPLQFQKQLRLFEAQRLMLDTGGQVAEAAYAVGYESSTQFVREYKRQFGESPLRDIRRRRLAFASLPCAESCPDQAA